MSRVESSARTSSGGPGDFGRCGPVGFAATFERRASNAKIGGKRVDLIKQAVCARFNGDATLNAPLGRRGGEQTAEGSLNCVGLGARTSSGGTVPNRVERAQEPRAAVERRRR